MICKSIEYDFVPSTIMWLVLVISIGSYSSYITALNGDNVCPEEERFTTNVTQLVSRNVTVRNYKWCVNIPPRCSYYTEKQRHVIEVIEKEDTRLVDKCCPGFKEDKKRSTCIFDCSQCVTNECKLSNNCVCHPGFWGAECDLACPDYFWGPNCAEKCSCTKGDCSPITGYCNCPPGWTGSRCEEQDEPIIRKHLSNSTILLMKPNDIFTEWNKSVKSITKQSDRAHYQTFQKYFTFIVTTHTSPSNVQIESDLTNLEDSNYPLSISTRKKASVLVSHTETVAEIPSHTSLLLAVHNVGGSTEVSTESVAAPSIIQESRTKQNQNNSVQDRAISVAQVSNVIVKEKVTESIEVSVTSTQTVSSEGSWLNDQSTANIDTNSSTRPNEIYINNGHLIFSVGAVVGILATVIIIVAVTIVTFITTQSYKRNKVSILGISRNTKNGNLNGELSAVAIYTRSVFHASLPEPPVLENPGFTTPLENRPKPSTLEARVICSMHLQNETNNRKDGRVVDELYDHPPSTGSYRAASIPEPPDNSLQMVSSQSKEHLYDEIPCWKQATENNNGMSMDKLSYYANTPSYINR